MIDRREKMLSLGLSFPITVCPQLFSFFLTKTVVKDAKITITFEYA